MIIAKTNPVETLGEHTNELLTRYETLKKSYKDDIEDDTVWKLLYLAVVYHDAGKAYTHFQKRMKSALGYHVQQTDFVHIPHNYLSPFFLPLNKIKLNKHHRRILIEAITYHHERKHTLEPEQLIKIAEVDLIYHFTDVQEELDVEVAEDQTFFKRIAQDMSRNRTKRKESDSNYLIYVLVKGLLHRLDHAASAHVDIEIDSDYSLSELTKSYLKKLTNQNENYLRPLQQFTLQHQEKNLILTAQTGMGKTEAALLWAGKKKTFFTVPLRVSLNALYDRVANGMNYNNCGLLHSTSAHHLDESGMENWEVIYDQSQHFANKLIFTTIDQILKFPFKFRGYEKYYATLAYSCVIIDEIQAYSPWLVAVITKALEMIHDIGGRFMIMTATLPSIYLDTLRERNVIDQQTIVKEFYDDTVLRHRIQLEETSILDAVPTIAESSKTKKVLVIVNTVNQSIELYNHLKEEVNHVHLFHARFLQKDRQLLEEAIKNFDWNEQSGVWITTQIVEASIDIDFDELHTELAPLDSLFQRFGRCYRKRELTEENENIHIYTEHISGRGSVYDKDILHFSKELLNKHIDCQGPEILESFKMKMVEHLYSKQTLRNTKFYDEFNKALDELDYMEDHIVSYTEAQKQLRGDQSVMVIPRSIYDDIIPLFERLETEEKSRKRTKLRREIERYTCSVRKQSYYNDLSSIDRYRQTKSGTYPLMSHLYILEKDYDFDEDRLQGVGIVNEEGSFEFV